MRYRAFIDDEDEIYRLEYYHNPKWWTMNMVSDDNPIKNIPNWPYKIKYLNESNNDISDEMKTSLTLQEEYIFFILKGRIYLLLKTIFCILEDASIQVGRISEKELRSIILIRGL